MSDVPCEAMVVIAWKKNGEKTYTRCFKTPTDIHHMLTRARGGLILDQAGETAHLIHLCRRHHNKAHGPGGFESGLMIDGYVTTGADGRPVYEGSDPRLRHLRAVDLPDVQKEVPGPEHG